MVVTQPVVKRYVGERRRFYGARPWCDVPAVVFNTKPAPRFTQRRRACVLCLSGGGAARKLAARARRAALDVVELRPIEGRRPGARPLSFDARPWRDVPAAASNTKPAPHVSPVYLARLRACYHEGGGSAFKLTVRAP